MRTSPETFFDDESFFFWPHSAARGDRSRPVWREWEWCAIGSCVETAAECAVRADAASRYARCPCRGGGCPCARIHRFGSKCSRAQRPGDQLSCCECSRRSCPGGNGVPAPVDAPSTQRTSRTHPAEGHSSGGARRCFCSRAGLCFSSCAGRSLCSRATRSGGCSSRHATRCTCAGACGVTRVGWSSHRAARRSCAVAGDSGGYCGVTRVGWSSRRAARRSCAVAGDSGGFCGVTRVGWSSRRAARRSCAVAGRKRARSARRFRFSACGLGEPLGTFAASCLRVPS
jgi:hypothetical protein